MKKSALKRAEEVQKKIDAGDLHRTSWPVFLLQLRIISVQRDIQQHAVQRS